MSIYMFSFIYVWFLVRGFFFQIHCIFAEMFLFLKKNSWKPNHLCARSLYFEKCCDFEQVKKLFLACMCSWKLMWNKLNMYRRIYEIYSNNLIYKEPPPPTSNSLKHTCMHKLNYWGCWHTMETKIHGWTKWYKNQTRELNWKIDWRAANTK